MQSQHHLKIIRGKGSYGCDKNITSISTILKSSSQLNKLTQLRILHCPKLSSVEGIQACQKLVTLNISCNSISSLVGLRPLLSLQSLDVKANCLKSLNGVQNIINLVKLDASQNLIETCKGLGDMHKRLEIIILFGNKLDDLDELKRLKNLVNLREISFMKGALQRSNPFCGDKTEYYQALQYALSNCRNTLVKIDDLSQAQVKQFLKGTSNDSYNKQQSKPQLSHNSISYNNTQLADVQKQQQSRFQKQTRKVNRDVIDQKMLLMSQRQADLEHIISLKQDNLEQLKYKYHQLQITNANQFRESIKKEAEYERVTGQITEMAKNIDRKEQKMNDLHKRIEELLKVNAAANSLADTRATQLQKLRRDFSEQRIQNSELKVLNKDQENRLRELQSKTLSNIQDKSQRIQQLRSKNEQVLRQNYTLQKEHQQYKDRIRELTQLIKQWQSKYQQTLKQLQGYHKQEKDQLLREYESKIGQLRHKSDQALRYSSSEWEQKLKVIERQYSITLENAIQKYSKLRKLFDERSESQAQLKAVLKASMNKNRQYQNTLKQYEQTLIKSKKAIISLTTQNEGIRKEYYDFRGKIQGQLRHFQNELSKAAYGKEKAEKQLKELKMSNDYLEKSLHNLNMRQKQFEQLLQKNESLQTALDAKNVMLDDKNDRIQSLKAQIESMQKDQEQKVDIAEMEKLSQKYKRQKQLLKSLEAKCANLSQQNQALAERCQTHGLLEEQVGEVREIIGKQAAELQQKQQTLTKYYQSIEKLKVFSENLLAENGIMKGENNRLLNSLNEKQMRYRQALKERESQWQRKINNSQQQMKKYKSIAEKFLSFSKTVNI